MIRVLVRSPLSRVRLPAALAIVAAMTTGLAVAPAHAQVAGGNSARASALTLNHRARELYQQGHYAEAAGLLREAYRLRPEPVLLYNLARACEKLADYDCAITAYESYLASHPADGAAVATQLANCRAQRTAAALPLPVSGLPPPEPPAPQLPSPAPRDPQRSLAPPIVSAVGVVGLGVGLGLVIAARARNDAAAQDPTQRGAEHEQERADALLRAGNLTLLGGGAVAISGALWWLIDVRSHRPATASAAATASTIRISGNSVAVAVRF